MKHGLLVRTSIALFSLVLAASCSSSGIFGPTGSSPNPASQAPAGLQTRVLTPNAKHKIAHVIFIVQENRSFNYMFLGYPNAVTQNYGYNTKGKKITLHEQTMGTSWDLAHEAGTFFGSCDGTGSVPGTDCKMDGWNTVGSCCAGTPPPDPAYAYAPRSEVATYWQMGKQYVLADNAFQSNLDSSFIAHQYTIAGYASHGVDIPSSAWGCSGGSQDKVSTLAADRTFGGPITVCFKNPTIADESDAAGVTWRYYTGPIGGDGGLWSAYQAIKQIYSGPDWASDVITPPDQFLTDVANGDLANITWVTPGYRNSDHPGFNSTSGPAWVASVVNAVGQSPFWDSSAIFVLWDDWGGWFDPVPPPYEDYDGLGFRIPLLMISPYAKKGYVTHVQYETSSVLKFMENNFGLAPLAASDTRAADPTGDAFDLTQKPRKFKPFAGSKSRAYWAAQPRATSRPGQSD
jgi:phospholipase C